MSHSHLLYCFNLTIVYPQKIRTWSIIPSSQSLKLKGEEDELRALVHLILTPTLEYIIHSDEEEEFPDIQYLLSYDSNDRCKHLRNHKIVQKEYNPEKPTSNIFGDELKQMSQHRILFF